MSQAEEQMSVAGHTQSVDLVEEQTLVARRNQNDKVTGEHISVAQHIQRADLAEDLMSVARCNQKVEVADTQKDFAQHVLTSELRVKHIRRMGLFEDRMPDAPHSQSNELIEG